MSRPGRTVWLLAALLASGMLASAGPEVRRREEARAAYRATPAGLYAHYCAHCHGTDGSGDGRLWSSQIVPRPADLTALDVGREDILATLRGGSAARGRSNLCPPWGRTLTPPDLERLAQHLVGLQARHQDTARGPPMPAVAVETESSGLVSLVLLAESALFAGLLLLRRRRPSHEPRP